MMLSDLWNRFDVRIIAGALAWYCTYVSLTILRVGHSVFDETYEATWGLTKDISWINFNVRHWLAVFAGDALIAVVASFIAIILVDRKNGFLKHWLLAWISSLIALFVPTFLYWAHFIQGPLSRVVFGWMAGWPPLLKRVLLASDEALPGVVVGAAIYCGIRAIEERRRKESRSTE